MHFCLTTYKVILQLKKFVPDVVTRQRQNRDKTINITVQKRNNVDWNYVVDSSGNKTTVGL